MEASSVYIISGLEGTELVCRALLENPLPGTVVRNVEAVQNQP